MFSKALLLLAICFQALSTGNSANYEQKLGGVWQKGKSANVRIVTYTTVLEAAPFVGGSKQPYPISCKVESQDKRGDIGDCLLVSFGGLESRLAINSYVNEKWHGQDDYGNLNIISPIDLEVIPEEEGFKIKYKGEEYFRKYEFPLENIKRVKIICPLEDKITANVYIEE